LPCIVELLGLVGHIEHAEHRLALLELAIEVHVDFADRQLEHVTIGAEGAIGHRTAHMLDVEPGAVGLGVVARHHLLEHRIID
jgi:hypothetical protein